MWWRGSKPNARRVGFVLSRSVRDHVHGRLELTFEELGPLDLKNIARPVEAFVVKLGAGVPKGVPLAVTMPDPQHSEGSEALSGGPTVC